MDVLTILALVSDHVIVRKRDGMEVLVVRAVRGFECSTNHSLVRSKMQLAKHPQMRRHPAFKRLNCALLKNALTTNVDRRALKEKRSQHPPVDPDNKATIKRLLQNTAEEPWSFLLAGMETGSVKTMKLYMTSLQ